jgi:uncharacterized protein YbjQ (UPF0145 family)
MDTRNFIITTTPSIQGCEIQSYLGVISSHVVAATNIFSDILATLSDIFGGRSLTYQKHLSAIHQEALEILKEKAITLGANCIIGHSIDHDQISGGGKSMFMVTATGTAVYVDKIQSHKVFPKQNLRFYSNDLAVQLRKNQIIESVKEDGFVLNDKEWQFLIDHQISEIAPKIMEKVLSEIEKSAFSVDKGLENELRVKSRKYFLRLPPELVKPIIYNSIDDKNSTFPYGNRNPIFSYIEGIIRNGKLLDFQYINKMIDSEIFNIQKFAIDLLRLDKTYYTADDLTDIKYLCRKIEATFIKKGQYSEKKSKSIFKTKKIWTCECGKENDSHSLYCLTCSNDIYGFCKSNTKPLEILKLLQSKYSVLKEQFPNVQENGA